MAKARYQGPADRLQIYEELVASVEGVDRKGAANPYTSQNGYMTSFLDKVGEVSIRLDKPQRDEFIETYDSRISEQYGSKMREFVLMPDDLVGTAEGRDWFRRSWEWVGTLEPRPTKE